MRKCLQCILHTHYTCNLNVHPNFSPPLIDDQGFVVEGPQKPKVFFFMVFPPNLAHLILCVRNGTWSHIFKIFFWRDFLLFNNSHFFTKQSNSDTPSPWIWVKVQLANHLMKEKKNSVSWLYLHRREPNLLLASY